MVYEERIVQNVLKNGIYGLFLNPHIPHLNIENIMVDVCLLILSLLHFP